MKCRTRDDYKRKQRKVVATQPLYFGIVSLGHAFRKRQKRRFPRPQSRYMKELLRELVALAKEQRAATPKPEKVCSISLKELRSCWGL